MAKRATTIVGACGEHYVAAYLSGFELIVALPRAGVPGCDMLVTNQDGGHAIRIQVKTGTQSKRKKRVGRDIYLWATSFAAMKKNDKHLWYAYVWLNGWPQGEQAPEIFFVPSDIVARVITECHDAKESWPFFWLHVDEAQNYKGQAGLKGLLDSLNRKPTT